MTAPIVNNPLNDPTSVDNPINKEQILEEVLEEEQFMTDLLNESNQQESTPTPSVAAPTTPKAHSRYARDLGKKV